MKHKLTAVQVKNQKAPGMYSDGGGLYLRVTKTGSKSWMFRWRDKSTGKLRDMGLGAIDDYSLAKAREAAEGARETVQEGRDPIAERDSQKAQRAAQAATVTPIDATQGVTFDQAAKQYIDSKVEPESKNAKHVQQWRNTLEEYASPVIGKMPIDQITMGDILKILDPIWKTKTETATRVRQRLERILGWATVMEYRSGENPARWENYLDNVLPSPKKVKNVKHFDSLPYSDLPEFMKELRKRPATSARALEFLILTAARSGDVRGALWSEIDEKAKLWAIPAERMKMKREHTIPLSPAAMKVLENQKGEHEEFIFPNQRGTGCLSNMAMETLLRRMKRKDGITVHGFRSTFKTWCQEKASKYPDEASELQLAHVNNDATRAAYARSQLIDIRAKLMNDWAKFIDKKKEKGS